MQFIKMNYKDFEFPANPSSLKIELTNNIADLTSVLATNKTQFVSTEPVIISGSGTLIGDNAKAVADMLRQLFKETTSDYLFSPAFEPIKMFFNKLSITLSASNNRIDYNFEFKEDTKNKKSTYEFGYTFAKKDENLFDIANRTGISVERIFWLNDFPNAFDVSEGDKVMLC